MAAKWLHIIVLVILFGVSKGHHIIRLVILAALGLAGLWMVHTLAQDYQNIAAGHHGGGGGKSETTVEFSKLFSKRSITQTTDNNHKVCFIMYTHIEYNMWRQPSIERRSHYFKCQFQYVVPRWCGILAIDIRFFVSSLFCV